VAGPSIDAQAFGAVVARLACRTPDLRPGDKPINAFKLVGGAKVAVPSGITGGATPSGVNAEAGAASPRRMGTLAEFAKDLNVPV